MRFLRSVAQRTSQAAEAAMSGLPEFWAAWAKVERHVWRQRWETSASATRTIPFEVAFIVEDFIALSRPAPPHRLALDKRLEQFFQLACTDATPPLKSCGAA